MPRGTGKLPASDQGLADKRADEPGRAAPAPPPADKVLVIKLGSLGDVIQADGAFRDIRAAYPAAEIVGLTMPAYVKLLDRCPWIDRAIPDPRRPRWRLDAMAALRATLRAERFGMVFDLQTQRRTNFYHRWFLSDVPWSGIAPGCSHPDTATDRKSRPALVRIAGQLRQAGIDVRHTLEPDATWMAEPVDGLMAEAGLTPPFIALIPGCSARHPEKRWRHYAALAERLLALGYGVVTAPGPDEMDLCRAIPGTTLTGGRFLDFFQLGGLFARAAFVVGNDTGPTHLAANMNRPGLALFGAPGAAVGTGLDRPSFQAIERDPLTAITVEEVLERVRAAVPPPR